MLLLLHACNNGVHPFSSLLSTWLCSKHATRPQKKWSKLKLRTQHKAKCADFHIMYAVSHIKHAEKKGSMMKLKVCFAPKFLARKIVAENNYLDLKQKRSLCAWHWTHCGVFSKGPRAAYVPLFKFKAKRLQSRNPPRLWHLTRLGTSLWIAWKLRLPSSTA